MNLTMAFVGFGVAIYYSYELSLLYLASLVLFIVVIAIFGTQV